MNCPLLAIDLRKIQRNAERIIDLCRGFGIGVTGIVKAICADPAIVRTLQRAGIRKFADARLKNLVKLRNAGIRCELALLRVPMPSEAVETVRHADTSYHSEIATIRTFNHVAKSMGKVHNVILMIEAGDLREGILPGETIAVVEQILRLSFIRLEGLAFNVGCFYGAFPTLDNTAMLVRLAETVKSRFGLPLPVISVGGGTICLPFLKRGLMPGGINELRCGEALYLDIAMETGEALHGGMSGDAFELWAEIIELRSKPSGLAGAGNRLRAILAVGTQDAPHTSLRPRLPGAKIVKATSDHMVVDVEDVGTPLRVGDTLSFIPDYWGLLALMTSPYVAKRYV